MKKVLLILFLFPVTSFAAVSSPVVTPSSPSNEDNVEFSYHEDFDTTSCPDGGLGVDYFYTVYINDLTASLQSQISSDDFLDFGSLPVSPTDQSFQSGLLFLLGSNSYLTRDGDSVYFFIRYTENDGTPCPAYDFDGTPFIFHINGSSSSNSTTTPSTVSVIDDPQRNFFYAILLFLLSFAMMVWMIRKQK